MTRLFRRWFSRDDLDCQDTRKLGSDFLDGDISPRKRSSVQAHLDKCRPCRAFIDTLASTVGILSRFPRVSPPPSFKQSIIEQTREDNQTPESRS